MNLDPVQCVHERLGEQFLHPEFGFYTDLPLDEHREFFPTEQEVRDCLPCPTSWLTGIEDGAINTGLNLEAQAIGFEQTGDERYLQRGRQLIDGLLRLATCGSSGFVARAVFNAQGLHYPQSSVDQYTLAVFGLWRVFRTEIPTPEQKSGIQRVLGEIARKFFRENGEITGDTGRPEREFTQGGPRDCIPGVERTLEMFLAAYAVTGDDTYLDYYRRWIADATQVAVPDLIAQWNPNPLIQTYALWQTQSAFRLLWEVETDSELRNAYAMGMKKVSDLCVPRLKKHRLRCDHMLAGRDNVGWRACYQNFEGWSNLKELMGLTYYYYYCHPIQAHESEYVANPLMAAQAILWNPDPVRDNVRDDISNLLARFREDLCRLSHSLVLFEGVHRLMAARRSASSKTLRVHQ